MAKDKPLVLISWLSLLPLEDLPEFSDLTGVPAEHLVQSLLYRLRGCGEGMSDWVQEPLKVLTAVDIPNGTFEPTRVSFVLLLFLVQRVLTHILLRVDR